MEGKGELRKAAVKKKERVNEVHNNNHHQLSANFDRIKEGKAKGMDGGER